MAPWFYRALESVSNQHGISIILFTHARSESINADSLKLQLLTARKKEWWPATADSLPQAVYLTTETHCVSGNRTHDLPIVSPTRYQLCHRDHRTSISVLCQKGIAFCGMHHTTWRQWKMIPHCQGFCRTDVFLIRWHSFSSWHYAQCFGGLMAVIVALQSIIIVEFVKRHTRSYIQIPQPTVSQSINQGF